MHLSVRVLKQGCCVKTNMYNRSFLEVLKRTFAITMFTTTFFTGTKWQGSTIQMQFQLGNAFKDDSLVEAELVVTSKQGSLWMNRKFIVSVYCNQSILAPNDTEPLDSHFFPRRANVEFGLNVTRAVKGWSLLTAKTYTLQV